MLFQSTLSMRRATGGLIRLADLRCISIHALHEESDVLVSGSKVLEWYFNPRSP